MKYKMYLLIAALLSSTVVFAQSAADMFPSKPVRIILPFGRGGSSDTFVRAMQPKLETALGQPVHRKG